MNNLLSLDTEKGRYNILAVVMILAYLLVFLPGDIFIMLGSEDSLFEYATAFAFLFIAIAFFLLFLNPAYLKNEALRATYSSKKARYVFFLFALVFFFGFGEEISWGQRIFGFATPENIAKRNVQNEFTIHNLDIFSKNLKDGGQKGFFTLHLSMKRLFLLSFFLFLFVIPLLDRYSSWFRNLFRRLYLPIPPVSLGILFIANYALYLLFDLYTDAIGDPLIDTSLMELQELNFALILLMLPLTWMQLRKQPLQQLSSNNI